MSEPIKMNDQLKQIEAELRQVRLPSSLVDRDEVLYQSGWAAAVASLGAAAQGRAKEQNRRAWVWPATSGVLATVAAVLGMLLAVDLSGKTGGDSAMIAKGRPVGEVGANEDSRQIESEPRIELSPRTGPGTEFNRGHVLASLDWERIIENEQGPFSAPSLFRSNDDIAPGDEDSDDEGDEGEFGGLNQFELMRLLLERNQAGG